MAGKQSAAMADAQKKVVEGHWTPTRAARCVGVAVSSIYRSAWYKAHRAAQKAAQQ